MIKLRHRYLVAPLLTAVAAMLVSLLAVVFVSADPGLRVSGAVCEGEVVPGESYIHKITVSTRETDSAMDIQIDVMGWGQSLQGIARALQASEDTSSYSAREYITVEPESFHLEPGQSQDVVASIRIPEDVGSGGRYAIIYIHSAPAGEGQVAVVSAINTLVLLTIKDSQIVHKGKMTEFTISEVVSGQPIDILTTFQNTGNHHFKIKGEVTISDAQGEVLDTFYIPLTPSSMIPTMSRQLEASFVPQRELPAGVYSVTLKVMLEDNTILDEAQSTFEVGKLYTPPATSEVEKSSVPPSVPASVPASVTVTPGSPATLETEDRSIHVSFPQGSVTGQAEVSVQSYSPEQLPDPPSGFEFGTTFFRVDGLSGLLAKEATLTFKYSAADLAQAGGNASRLTLARWDEANNEWSVLKTEVDEEAMTLTTRTNQLSIWAVMVGAPPEPTSWGLIIGGIMGGMIIIGLLVYFLVMRRRVTNK